VSIEALVGGNAAVVAAHEAAVSEALRYLEARAVNVRVTNDGVTRRESTDNLVVARFQHHTSRRLDPQLHTHALVLNATRTRDGQWKAVVNDDLYRHKMAAGAVYRAHLALGLQQLGYGIRVDHADGRFEVDGYTREQISTFSKRRKEIVQALQGPLGDKLRDLGLDGAEAAKRANLGTRERKQSVDHEALRQVWREQARDAGIAIGPPGKSRRRASAQEHDPAAASTAVQWAVDHVEERKAVMDEHDIVRHALQAGIGQVSLRDIEGCIEARKLSGELVVTGIRREGQERYASSDTLALEAHTIALARRGRGRHAAIASRDAVENRLDGSGLTAGQRQAADLILRNEDLAVGVQGFAGTGKTTMLRAVREVAEESGFAVRGLVVSASAASELATQAGIQSTTVALHTKTRANERRSFLQPKPRELWVVDESSLLCTRDAHNILASAERLGARVAFVGDREQLPGVEAGKPFAQLGDRCMQTAVMPEILRQRNETALRAVQQTIAGDAQAAVRTLYKTVFEEPNATERAKKVSETFLRSSAAERQGTLIVTTTNAERREINNRIREGLVAEGAIHGPASSGAVLVRKDLTEAETRRSVSYETGDIIRITRKGGYKRFGLAEGEYLTVQIVDDTGAVRLRRRSGAEISWIPERASKVEAFREEHRQLAAGDKIRWTRNDHRLGRKNGGIAEVTTVATETQTATVKLSDGSLQTLHLGAEKHWDYAYASTVHGAQGATCDRVIVNINTEKSALVGHESWYVAISRAREDVIVFTNDKTELPDAIAQSRGKESALEERERHSHAGRQGRGM
jgi:conjugative relaxase-like TrwC/TraI family protein